jgi:hypothetical protein
LHMIRSWKFRKFGKDQALPAGCPTAGAAPIVAIPPPAKTIPRRRFLHRGINSGGAILFRRQPASRIVGSGQSG